MVDSHLSEAPKVDTVTDILQCGNLHSLLQASPSCTKLVTDGGLINLRGVRVAVDGVGGNGEQRHARCVPAGVAEA